MLLATAGQSSGKEILSSMLQNSYGLVSPAVWLSYQSYYLPARTTLKELCQGSWPAHADVPRRRSCVPPQPHSLFTIT